MISADSVKAKLKNQAQKQGRLFQDELVAYFLEPIIEGIRNESYYIAEWSHNERNWRS